METTPASYALSQPEQDNSGFLSANLLKLIAILAMAIDHIAHLFVPPDTLLYIVMRMIGRITGPTMFYFAAAGYHYTRNKNRYTLRLALFALVSYIPFIYCFEGALPNSDNFLRLNVIYTILIGHLCIRARHELKNPILKWSVIIVLFILAYVGDWYYLCPLIMLAFDFYHGDFRKQATAYILVILGAGNLLSYAYYPIAIYLNQHQWDFSIYRNLVSEMGMFIPIILLYYYNGKKGGGGAVAKWGFYIFYPLHLLILGFIANRIMP